MDITDIADRLDTVAERLKGFSQICLMLTRSDRQEDYTAVYQILYRDLDRLADELKEIFDCSHVEMK